MLDVSHALFHPVRGGPAAALTPARSVGSGDKVDDKVGLRSIAAGGRGCAEPRETWTRRRARPICSSSAGPVAGGTALLLREVSKPASPRLRRSSGCLRYEARAPPSTSPCSTTEEKAGGTADVADEARMNADGGWQRAIRVMNDPPSAGTPEGTRGQFGRRTGQM